MDFKEELKNLALIRSVKSVMRVAVENGEESVNIKLYSEDRVLIVVDWLKKEGFSSYTANGNVLEINLDNL